MIVVLANYGIVALRSHGSFRKINWFPKDEFLVFFKHHIRLADVRNEDIFAYFFNAI